jgi:uncharacterized damage-inducible protein DinB
VGDEVKSRAVRALALLHDQRMREFLPIWKEVDRKKVALPKSENPNYQSSGALLRHVLGAGRRFLVWTAESLKLPDPGVPEPPAAEQIGAEADRYMEAVLAAWGASLAGVEQAQLRDKRYPWSTLEMYVETLLEHAVVHPERHRFQLEELLGRRAS